eukprot:CAMPEP_0176343340 /NCGR_PEP_ID=MMETSP0126-20121128/3877_1 /TAXON_ID=141414 ORGANISM="Strombidinopsis acuminatum, Strain SPMC142" /NCGR_SAMPLE_ID=MMETSP0126 /ASSEMBLY_ACC=CAM_ASM_000229 /LENGTH=65 /DNA_ID=CAMNT_0017689253 /DNA_START=1820 /DNA_END=2017 /DNA_ORIENTATION=+
MTNLTVYEIKDSVFDMLERAATEMNAAKSSLEGQIEDIDEDTESMVSLAANGPKRVKANHLSSII